MELSAKWPIKDLCDAMCVSRSGVYKFRNRYFNPGPKLKKRLEDVALFQKYHDKFQSHGYRWLNAKIQLDLGIKFSNQYAP